MSILNKIENHQKNYYKKLKIVIKVNQKKLLYKKLIMILKNQNKKFNKVNKKLNHLI